MEGGREGRRERGLEPRPTHLLGGGLLGEAAGLDFGLAQLPLLGGGGPVLGLVGRQGRQGRVLLAQARRRRGADGVDAQLPARKEGGGRQAWGWRQSGRVSEIGDTMMERPYAIPIPNPNPQRIKR